MPSHAPRSKPVKKQEELSMRKQVLRNAIQNKYSEERLNKAAEKYQVAQLSLFKATIHFFKEKIYGGRPSPIEIEIIENKIAIWSEKTIEEIIGEVTEEMNKS